MDGSEDLVYFGIKFLQANSLNFISNYSGQKFIQSTYGAEEFD